MKKLLIIGMLLAAACTETAVDNSPPESSDAGPSAVDPEALAEVEVEQPMEEGSGDETAPVTTRLTVLLSQTGEMEVLSAMELEGARHKDVVVNEFVYDAAVDGKIIAAGSFTDPFARRSANNPTDGYDHEVTPEESAVIVIDLPGVQTDRAQFDISVERLTQNPQMRTMNFETLETIKDRGGAVPFSRMKREKLAEALKRIPISSIRQDALRPLQ